MDLTQLKLAILSNSNCDFLLAGPKFSGIVLTVIDVLNQTKIQNKKTLIKVNDIYKKIKW